MLPKKRKTSTEVAPKKRLRCEHSRGRTLCNENHRGACFLPDTPAPTSAGGCGCQPDPRSGGRWRRKPPRQLGVGAHLSPGQTAGPKPSLCSRGQDRAGAGSRSPCCGTLEPLKCWGAHGSPAVGQTRKLHKFPWGQNPTFKEGALGVCVGKCWVGRNSFLGHRLAKGQR